MLVNNTWKALLIKRKRREKETLTCGPRDGRRLSGHFSVWFIIPLSTGTMAPSPWWYSGGTKSLKINI